MLMKENSYGNTSKKGRKVCLITSVMKKKRGQKLKKQRVTILITMKKNIRENMTKKRRKLCMITWAIMKKNRLGNMTKKERQTKAYKL